MRSIYCPILDREIHSEDETCYIYKAERGKLWHVVWKGRCIATRKTRASARVLIQQMKENDQ